MMIMMISTSVPLGMFIIKNFVRLLEKKKLNPQTSLGQNNKQDSDRLDLAR